MLKRKIRMSIKEIIETINKKYKRNVIMTASDARGLIIYKVSTGSVALDLSLRGGIALGRLNQISGPYSSGKSVLCATIAKNFLDNKIIPAVPAPEKGKRCAVYVDLEGSFDPKWLEYLGVDMDRFLPCNPNSGEQTWDVVCDIMDLASQYEKPDQVIFFIDSLAAALPSQLQDSTLDGSSAIPGAHARLVSHGISKFITRLKRELDSPNPEFTMIFVNQKRMKIGVMFGDPEIETGGRAPGFFSSQIIRVRRGEHILDGKNKVGFELSWLLHKDKTGGEERGVGTARFFRNPSKSEGVSGGQFDNEGDIIPFAVELEVLERKGAYYAFEGTRLGCGKTEVAAFFRANPEVYAEVEEMCLRKALAERDHLREDQKSGNDKQGKNEEKPATGEKRRCRVKRKEAGGKR